MRNTRRKHGPVRHGSKWRIRPIDEHGKRVSKVFDDFKSAQFEGRRIKTHVEEVKRGLRRAAPVDHTFDELAEYWLQNRAPHKRSEKDDKSILSKHLRPAFGRMRLRDIGIEDWDAYVNDHDDLAGKTVDNHRVLLTAMLNVAATFKVPWVLTVPKFRRTAAVLSSTDYAWLKSEDEVARFLAAARNEGELVYTFYAVALYTGLRAGELAGLEDTSIDLEHRIIHVVRSYDGPTKTNLIRHVPILDPLLPVLRDWLATNPGRLVFPNRDGHRIQPSSRIYQEVLHRVLDAAKFPRRMVRWRERYYIGFHGLRHTFASRWVLAEGDIYRLQTILGHTTIKLTQRYAHLSPAAFAQDYGRLGAVLPVAESNLRAVMR